MGKDESIQTCIIKSNLLIFKKVNHILFLNFKTGKRSKIDSTKYSLGYKDEKFFLESDNKTLLR